MGTGWFGHRPAWPQSVQVLRVHLRIRHISACATRQMVGTAFLGAGAVPSLFAQLVFAGECGLASLQFCVVGGGASERAHGHARDESAGRRAKCVCNNVFCPGFVRSQDPPKLCTSVLSLVMCRVGS